MAKSTPGTEGQRILFAFAPGLIFIYFIFFFLHFFCIYFMTTRNKVYNAIIFFPGGNRLRQSGFHKVEFDIKFKPDFMIVP